MPVDSLLSRMEANQSTGDAFFDEGIFVSFRNHLTSSKYWKDDNIFFSQLIAFTLQQLAGYMEPYSLEVSDNMIKKVIMNYPKYKNKDGFITYNFWKTKPPKHFPNSTFLSKFDKFIVPDDMDDTSMAYLTLAEINDSILFALKDEMVKHTNGYRLKVKNIPRKYQEYKAYSIWFGKDMPIEFDISVMSNVLYFLFEKKLPLNQYDTACMKLIRQIVIDEDYLKNPSYYSSQYKTSPVIIYHLSRLIEKFNPELLSPLIMPLINHAKIELQKTNSLMEKVLLSTSLIRLGAETKDIIRDSDDNNDIDYYSFYAANYTSTLSNPLRKWLSASNLLSTKFVCPAYNYMLLLEYKILYEDAQSIHR